MTDAADRFEYMVRSRYVPLNRTIESGPTDEETARVILGDALEGYERQLLRRVKASEWEPVTDD